MEEENVIEIPKIIHFIWAGGVKALPNDSEEVIAEWAVENDQYDIYLWLDTLTSGENFEDLK